MGASIQARNQFVAVAPVVDDKVLEPFQRQIGVVGDDDLELPVKLVCNAVLQLVHALDRDGWVSRFGRQLSISTSDG